MLTVPGAPSLRFPRNLNEIFVLWRKMDGIIADRHLCNNMFSVAYVSKGRFSYIDKKRVARNVWLLPRDTSEQLFISRIAETLMEYPPYDDRLKEMFSLKGGQ